MPLALIVSCFSKIQIDFIFLFPADPGSPGKRAVKQVCVRACFVIRNFVILPKIRTFLSWTSPLQTSQSLHQNEFLLPSRIQMTKPQDRKALTAYGDEANAPTIRLDATPTRLLVPPTSIIPHFYADCPFFTTLPSYPGLGQAPNNAGLHTRWLGLVLPLNERKCKANLTLTITH